MENFSDCFEFRFDSKIITVDVSINTSIDTIYAYFKIGLSQESFLKIKNNEFEKFGYGDCLNKKLKKPSSRYVHSGLPYECISFILNKYDNKEFFIKKRTSNKQAIDLVKKLILSHKNISIKEIA